MVTDLKTALSRALFSVQAYCTTAAVSESIIAPVSYTHLDVYKRQVAVRSVAQYCVFETHIYYRLRSHKLFISVTVVTNQFKYEILNILLQIRVENLKTYAKLKIKTNSGSYG